MPIIGQDSSDALEPIAVEPGEYELRIVDVKVAENKDGNPYVMPRFEILEVPNAKEFGRYIGLVHDDMTEKQRNSAKYAMKSFCEAFGIDPSAPGDTDDWVGSTGWAILGLEESAEYGEQNYVKKFVTGS